MTQSDAPEKRFSAGRLAKVALIGLCIVVAIVIAAVLVVKYIRYQDVSQRLTSDGMILSGEENFNGPKDAPPPDTYFGYDTGGNGWGNGEKQLYTRDIANSRLSGDGQLILQAQRKGEAYTSARLITRTKVEFGSGLLEARIKFPQGDGLHSAFWLLGSNVQTVNWPQCGEIDVIEIVDSGDTYHNAIHGPLAADPSVQWQKSHDGPVASNLADDFHIYQVYRQPGVIKIGIDGRIVGTYETSNIPQDARWVFEAPMYLVFNIAIGGDWPKPMSPSTAFPATMQVDWVRYWR
jgi:beta-glucanase (GH16 family)